MPDTARVTSLVLDLPGWPGHRAGQHVDIRLTAEDGYQAQRSYSIASAPEDAGLVLTVERLDDGEVSPYLVEELRPGDELELRGPIGGFFVWEESFGGPLVLIGGGSGVVPLRSMLRHWAAGRRSVPVRLLYSSRSLEEVIYREELLGYASSSGAASSGAASSGAALPGAASSGAALPGAASSGAASSAGRVEVRFALTREWPEDYTGHTGRIDLELLSEVSGPPEDQPLIYVCGPSGFVGAAADWLVELGHAPQRIRTERFGPTGT